MLQQLVTFKRRAPVRELATFGNAREILGTESVYGLEECIKVFGIESITFRFPKVTLFTPEELDRVREVSGDRQKLLFLRYLSLGEVLGRGAISLDSDVAAYLAPRREEHVTLSCRLLVVSRCDADTQIIKRGLGKGYEVVHASVRTALNAHVLGHTLRRLPPDPIYGVGVGLPRDEQMVLMRDQMHRSRVSKFPVALSYQRLVEIRVASKRVRIDYQR